MSWTYTAKQNVNKKLPHPTVVESTRVFTASNGHKQRGVRRLARMAGRLGGIKGRIEKQQYLPHLMAISSAECADWLEWRVG
jgi:hypothetical protein